MACNSAQGTSVPMTAGGLEQAFVLRWQPIDARRQQRLHRGRDLQGLERFVKR
jgi:hypothetical protein